MTIEGAALRILLAVVIAGLYARLLGCTGCVPVGVLALAGIAAFLAWFVGVWLRRMA